MHLLLLQKQYLIYICNLGAQLNASRKLVLAPLLNGSWRAEYTEYRICLGWIPVWPQTCYVNVSRFLRPPGTKFPHCQMGVECLLYIKYSPTAWYTRGMRPSRRQLLFIIIINISEERSK